MELIVQKSAQGHPESEERSQCTSNFVAGDERNTCWSIADVKRAPIFKSIRKKQLSHNDGLSQLLPFGVLAFYLLFPGHLNKSGDSFSFLRKQVLTR